MSDTFIVVTYDDRERFPWAVMWGGANTWARYRTKEAADERAARLYEVCREYFEHNVGDLK